MNLSKRKSFGSCDKAGESPAFCRSRFTYKFHYMKCEERVVTPFIGEKKNASRLRSLNLRLAYRKDKHFHEYVPFQI